ncbi:MAG: hypothetical protein ACK55Z_23505, partial [bacterium]
PKESRVLGAPSASAPPQRTSSSRHWLQTIGKWNFGMAFGDSRKRVAANAKYAILRALSLTPPLFPPPPLSLVPRCCSSGRGNPGSGLYCRRPSSAAGEEKCDALQHLLPGLRSEAFRA